MLVIFDLIFKLISSPSIHSLLVLKSKIKWQDRVKEKLWQLINLKRVFCIPELFENCKILNILTEFHFTCIPYLDHCTWLPSWNRYVHYDSTSHYLCHVSNC